MPAIHLVDGVGNSVVHGPAIALTFTIQRTRWRVAYDTDGWPSETITLDATEEYDAQETTVCYMAVRELGYGR